MKRFLVVSVVSLLLLVSVAKCEEDEQLSVDEPAKIDLKEEEGSGNYTTLRSKRQGLAPMGAIGAIPGGMGPIGGGPFGGIGGPIGGIPSGPIGGIPSGPIGGIGGPIGGPIGGGGGFWPWDPCQPPAWCPRCPYLTAWDNWQCQNFCFQNRWCLCQQW